MLAQYGGPKPAVSVGVAGRVFSMSIKGHLARPPDTALPWDQHAPSLLRLHTPAERSDFVP